MEADGYYLHEHGPEEDYEIAKNTARELFYNALGRLSDLRFDRQRSPLTQIGDTAVTVIEALRDNYITLKAGFPEEDLTKRLVTLLVNTPTDEDDTQDTTLLPVEAVMLINMPKFLELYDEDIPEETLTRVMAADLVLENVAAKAYLDGTLADKGFRQIFLEGYKTYTRYLQHHQTTHYEHLPNRLNSDLYLLPKTHAPNQNLTSEDKAKLVKEELGEELNLLDCTFPAFRKAARKKLNLLNKEIEEGMEKSDDEESVPLDIQIKKLEELLSDDPDNMQDAKQLFLSLFCHTEVMLDVLNFCYVYLIHEITQQRILKSRRKTISDLSYEDLTELKSEAQGMFGEMPDNKREALIAKGLIGIWLNRYLPEEETVDITEGIEE